MDKRDKYRKKDPDFYKIVREENEAIEVLEEIFSQFEEKFDLSPQEVLKLLSKKRKYLSVPTNVLRQHVSPLEAVVKYIKEELKLKTHEIAKLLNRDETTIWTTYNNAIKKRVERFEIIRSEYNIPLSILGNRKLSCLEIIVAYLKEQRGLSFHKIAVELGKNDRTIWTVYDRVKKKR